MDIRSLLGLSSFIFAFWPLIVLAPLTWRKNILLGMIYLWAMFAILRILFFVFSIPVSVLFITEPLNTILLFATGGILILFSVARKTINRRSLQKKADDARNVEDLRQLSPKEFEDLVVEYYSALGNKAKRTGSTGDHGVDVIVDATNGEKWVIQCKRWRGSVGEPIIRDFHGVVQHEKADKGAIITTGTFTTQAREWVRGKPITLIEGDEFLVLLKKARNQPFPIIKDNDNKVLEERKAPLCPKCGREMVIRIAKKGINIGEKFWGCPSYPQCRGIVKYE
jgi:restriction system protein